MVGSVKTLLSLFDPIGLRLTIGIGEQHQVALRGLHAQIARVRRSAVRGANDLRGANNLRGAHRVCGGLLAQCLFRDVGGAVGGAIVDDDDLIARSVDRLLAQRVQTARQRGCGLIGGNDDREIHGPRQI